MKKVFIDWPSFSKNSNGIVCLYELGLSLHEAGFEVYGVPRNLRSFLRSLKRLPSKYRQIPIAETPFGSDADFFVAAETVPPRIIRCVRQHNIRVAWWGLAPYRLLDGKLMPRIGDLSLPYSSYVDPSAERYFYFQPEFDSHYMRALANQDSRVANERIRICLYNGKGRLRSLPPEVLSLCKNSEVIPITRNSPPTRAQLFDLLTSADGMISFDEFSAINLEAASLGIPVFLANPLFPPKCRQKFTIGCLKERVVDDASHFLHLVSLRRENTLAPWPVEDMFIENQATMSAWRDLLSSSTKCISQEVHINAITRFGNYTKALKRKRIISIHNAGQAGGTWLSSAFISAVSQGRNDRALLRQIALLDYLYMYFWPLLLIIERLPLIRLIIAKKRESKLLFAFIGGSRVYHIE